VLIVLIAKQSAITAKSGSPSTCREEATPFVHPIPPFPPNRPHRHDYDAIRVVLQSPSTDRLRGVDKGFCGSILVKDSSLGEASA
jgi:hypothetical protein